MTIGNENISRRTVLASAAMGAGGLSLGALGGLSGSEAAAPTRVVPLPSASAFRNEVQHMVDFGPRLTGYPAHRRFVSYLRREFAKIPGVELEACDEYVIDRWTPRTVALNILEGDDAGAVKIAFPWVRAASTGPQGVTGPLIYGGTLPAPTVNASDLSTLPAAIASYPERLASFAAALAATPTGLAGGFEGSVLLVDIPSPAPLTVGAFLPMANYLQWFDEDGNNRPVADWATGDFKRVWFGPYADLSPLQQLGIAGIVMIVDASFEAAEGSYTDHVGDFTASPRVVVDRDTGTKLRNAAAAAPQVRLVLDAVTDKQPIQSVMATLPGKSEETIIVSSHSDGQNAFEENGALAVLALARHFASLPNNQRLEKTLHFVVWPGHMTPDVHANGISGWIAAHPEQIQKAVGGISIEHLGALEWRDDENGYGPTGEKEPLGTWTTQGVMYEVAKASLIKTKVDRVALLRPPVMITPGASLHTAGIPFIGSIAGPNYLLVVSEDGEMDKFDARHAARQIAFFGDIVKRLDKKSAADTRGDDPTLGVNLPEGAPGHYASEVTSKSVNCAPTKRR